jgi:hypothetical protein
MKPLCSMALLLTLAACAGPGPGITGNDTGGIIPYPLVASLSQNALGTSDRATAQAMATDFCARYRKRAYVTSIHRHYGDYAAFDCRWR